MTSRNLLSRLLRSLPPGTLAVASGLAVLGLASFVHLAVAGHVLDDADMSSLSVLWAIVFSVGLGIFFPVEQEMARVIAAGRADATGAGLVLRRGATLAGTTLAVLLLLCVVARGPLTSVLFGGDRSLVWTLGGALAGLAVAHTTRGVLAGRGRFVAYGLQLGVDGGLRIALALAFAAAGLNSPFWSGAILTIAPVISVLVTLPATWAQATSPGPAVAWSSFVSGLGLLTVSSLASQVVVNIAVINARLLDPADTVAAAALLSATVLVRIPLFVFASLQASLLPSLSTAVASGDDAGFRGQLRRGLMAVTALGTVGIVVAITAGPALTVLLFDAPAGVMKLGDFAWLGVGTLAYLWALVLGQGAIAHARHRYQTLAWVVGVAVLALATFLPGGLTTRVSAAYALGSVAVVVVLAVVARQWLLPTGGPRSTDGAHRRQDPKTLDAGRGTAPFAGASDDGSRGGNWSVS